MALGKNRRRINVKGGGEFLIRELAPTPSDTFLDLGFIESVELNDDNQMVDIADAEGNLLDYLGGLRSLGVKITLAQSSFDELDWLLNTSGKYFDALYNVYLEGLAEWQSWSFPVFKVKPGGALTFAGATKRSPIAECRSVAPKAALVRTPTALNVTAWKPVVLYQNAVKVTTPSDTASSVATALI